MKSRFFWTLTIVAAIFSGLACDKSVEKMTGPDTSDGGNIPLATKSPLLKLGRATVDFGYNLSVADIAIDNGGDSSLTWQVTSNPMPSWFTANPLGGSLNGGGRAFVIMRPDRTGLTPGIHDGLIRFGSNGGDGEVYTMLRIADPKEPPQPKLFVTPPELNFGTSADTLFFAIINDGTGELNFSLSESIPWAKVISPLTGKAPANVQVVVDRNGLNPNTYRDGISISSNGGNATEQVKMVVPESIGDEFEASFDMHVYVVSSGGIADRAKSLDGPFTVGPYSFDVVLKHAILNACYTPIDGFRGPDSFHVWRLRILVKDNVARFFVDGEYSGDEVGQKDEAFFLEVNGKTLDRGTDCPVVPDNPGLSGRIPDIFCGKMQL